MALGTAFGSGFQAGSQAVTSGLSLKQKQQEQDEQKRLQNIKKHQSNIAALTKAYKMAVDDIYAKETDPEVAKQKIDQLRSDPAFQQQKKQFLILDQAYGLNPQATEMILSRPFDQPSPTQLAEQEAKKAGTLETAKGEAKGLTKTVEKNGVFKMVRSTDKEALDALIKEGWVERTASDVSGEESALTKSLGKALGKQIVENRQTAIKASDSIRTANEAIKLLDEGVVTGFGAEFIVNMGRAAKRLGFDVGTNIENTQAFAANQGKAVLDILGSGALGAGTGISDNDRLFAKQIAAGDISLDETAVRRIIELNAKVSGNVIDRHNIEAKNIGDRSPVSLNVEKPEFISGLPKPQSQEDFDAIPSGKEYISPADGKKYRKP